MERQPQKEYRFDHENTCDNADDRRSSRANKRARSRDRDEARQHAVTHHRRVRFFRFEPPHVERGRDRRSRRCQHRVHRNHRDPQVCARKRGAGIKAEPSEGQNKCPQHHERNIVRHDRVNDLPRAVVLAVARTYQPTKD